jgi:hypothetical protein
MGSSLRSSGISLLYRTASLARIPGKDTLPVADASCRGNGRKEFVYNLDARGAQFDAEPDEEE